MVRGEDTGASARADQALVASDQAAPRLAPTGVDPLRGAARLLRERDLRSRHVPSAFARGGAWAILLDLYRSEPQRISSVCYGSGYPYTTALRFLSDMEGAGAIERLPCDDKRGALVRLSQRTREQLTGYFEAIASLETQSIAP